MNSKQFEDDNGVMWTATIKPVGKATYSSFDFTKRNLLVFTTVDKRVSRKYKDVATEKSSISDFSIEELKTLLKESQQSKP